jgi:hypothetical protein
MGYLSYKWQWLCSACRNHNLTLSLLMTYHWVCNNSNATGTTGGTGTAYTSGTHECIPGICPICMFLYSICTSLCVLLSFWHCIVSSSLTCASAYYVGLFKHFLQCHMVFFYAVIVRFANIAESVDHHCLSFLFIK